MDKLALVVIAGMAAFRCGMLISWDKGPFNSCEKFRGWAGKKASPQKEHPLWFQFAELIHCPYCTGFWFSLLFVLIVFWREHYSLIIAYWIAASGVQFLVTHLASYLWNGE